MTSGRCSGNLTCNYGEECCNGECHPAIVSSCVQGEWISLATDACLDALDTTDAPKACSGKYKLENSRSIIIIEQELL